jgi:tetratricopeptide (TPR) repeat protein
MHAPRHSSSIGPLALLLCAAALVGLAIDRGRGHWVVDAQSPPAASRPLPEGAEAWSLFGEPLVPSPAGAEARARQAAQLAEARAALEQAPDSADALIWVGRRLAYLGRYREAIDMYTRGIARHPDNPKLYRHRGHRYISTRRFDLAIADFERASGLVAGKADEGEPDGQPNARNIPTSTLHFNIWYHLGLAHYLQGDFPRALAAYQRCLDVSANPDAQVATRHWLYMTLRRLGRTGDADQVLAPVSASMDIIENQAYHQLLLMYRGELSADALLSRAAGDLDRATIGYGVGNWHLYRGDAGSAVATFRQVLAAGQWASFGAIAAEADLHRLGHRP